MKRVLITGGTGFIGSRLALRCIEEGEPVRVLAQKNNVAEAQNADELEKQGVEIVTGSVSELDAVRRACEGVDTVYHLAAAQHEANVPDSHFYDVNVHGTENMLRGAADCSVRRFVHGSTIGVYGLGGDGPVTADSPTDPDNIYGVTKLAGERQVHAYQDEVPAVIVRISETYGPGDRRLLKLFRGIAGRRFLMVGPGENLHDLVYIDDLIDGMRLAAASDSAVDKTFVLAGPEAITTRQMVEQIAEAVGVTAPKLGIPLWPLNAAALVLETLLRPVGIQPPLHRRRMNFFVKSFRFTGKDALAAVGYRPNVHFREGAALTAEWYREQGLL